MLMVMMMIMMMVMMIVMVMVMVMVMVALMLSPGLISVPLAPPQGSTSMQPPPTHPPVTQKAP